MEGLSRRKKGLRSDFNEVDGIGMCSSAISSRFCVLKTLFLYETISKRLSADREDDCNGLWRTSLMSRIFRKASGVLCAIAKVL